jgi:hypothetical protein
MRLRGPVEEVMSGHFSSDLTRAIERGRPD